MATYKGVVAWQKAMELANAVYDAVQNFPKTEWFVLSAQMRSSAVSIPSNIAEGRGRGTDPDYRAFLIRARGSLFELETQIHLALRRELLDETTTSALLAVSDVVGQKLGALITYLGGPKAKGKRPKAPTA